MSNIHGLGGVKKEEPKKDTEQFSSSGHTSSTAVWRPAPGAGAGAGAGAGSGAPGGMQDIIAKAKGQQHATDAQDRSVGTITLYANGFILGEGEFRDSKDAKNAGFLKALMAGDVPDELEAECRREWGNVENVRVNLVDKSRDTYVPPKAKFNFSESQGMSLGGPAKSTTAGSFKTAVAKEYKANKEGKSTTLQLVLHPRTKAKGEFLHDATVLDVYQHVMFLTKLKDFDLVAGYPPKALANPNQTLTEAGLIGASIQQRVSGKP